ncbi:MAG TPA: cytochrome c [Anaerolineae bacterium]|nr:cytochrome c [Anaerolineae bacterium]
MQRREFRIGLILLVSAGAALLLFQRTSSTGRPVVINDTAAPPVPTLDLDRVEYGESLYTQYCAGCHGANLEGAADWKQRLPDGSLPPPPHDSSGHTWHHPDSLLVGIIANGGDPAYNSKMPAFKEKLHDDQIRAILEFMKSKWGDQEREFQWWITATQDQP